MRRDQCNFLLISTATYTLLALLTGLLPLTPARLWQTTKKCVVTSRDEARGGFSGRGVGAAHLAHPHGIFHHRWRHGRRTRIKHHAQLPSHQARQVETAQSDESKSFV